MLKEEPFLHASKDQEKMMQSEHFQPTWPLCYNISSAYSSLDPTGLYGFPMDVSMGAAAEFTDFSSSFSTQDSSGEISMDTLFADMTPPDLIDYQAFSNDNEIIDFFAEECRWMDESDSEGNLCPELTSEGSTTELWSPPEQHGLSATASPLSNMDLRLPGIDNNFKLDSQLVLHHLLTAYGEAMENDQSELMEVIAKRVNATIDPLGDPIQRLAFNLLPTAENQSGYLRQQSSKNFDDAFKVFYQMFPYGKFAHFSANSAILESIPKDAHTIHIVDLDMGNGIQWPPMIEAIGQKGKALRLTSIKPDAECISGEWEWEWQFEETKHRLYDHARSLGISLRVDEMSLGKLTTEIKRTKMKRTGGRDWLAFNCMVGLPHMCRRQNRIDVKEFVRVAKELLAYTASGRRSHAGILTFGDGEIGDDLEIGVGYSCYFNRKVMHYQGLLESMECSNLPTYLTEARLAVESLFVAPNICSVSWLEQWKHSREGQTVRGMEGKKISKESLNEAKELVNEKESSYKVKILGEKGNQLVLEWKGTPLINISSWM